MTRRMHWAMRILLTAALATVTICQASDERKWDGNMPEGGAASFGVWNAGILDKINPANFEFKAAGDRPGPIVMVGPRNGACSGQVVASDARPLAGLKASVSALKNSGGAVISADRIRIRFAAMKPQEELERLRFEVWQSPYFSDLLDAPPAARTVPVWVTVKIPQDALPGKYTGTLSVTSPAGKKIDVLLELTVSAWVCPPPRTWTPHLGIIQSPDAAALKYGKELWSEEHFKLIERSYQYIGELGGDLAWVPMVNQALSRGAAVSMVRYAMEPDGSAKCDFSTMNRYLDLHEKYCGKPEFCYFYLWYGRVDNTKYGQKPIPVTGMDGRTAITVPPYGTPEAERFWGDAIKQLLAEVRKRGWTEKDVILGLANEGTPTEVSINMFKKVAPWATWAQMAHGTKTDFFGMPVVYPALAWYMFTQNALPEWQEWRKSGKPPWANPVFCVTCKYKCPSVFGEPAYWRWRTENAMYGSHVYGVRGVSRLGADFWVVKGADGKLCRLEHHSGGQPTMWLDQGMPCLLAPGPDGPVATVHYELTREGLQELEARITIEKALVAGRATGALAKRCQDVVDSKKRTAAIMAGVAGKNMNLDWQGWSNPTWREQTRQLFDLAAEVCK